MFRRLRFGGVIPFLFVPCVVFGAGYDAISPKTAWILTALNQFNVIIRSWMAYKAYLDRAHPDPNKVGWWLARLRIVTIGQAFVWSILNTRMLFDFGHTNSGYLVMACIVGWTAAAPTILGTDVRLSRVLCILNPSPLFLWAIFDHSTASGLLLALSTGLVGVAFLLTGLQYSSARGMYSARIGLEFAHRQLRVAKSAADAAATAKGQFLANMSHEIRTPLNGIIGLAEMLQQTGLDAAAAEITADLRRSGQHLLAIVNDVLDISKITASKMAIESLPMDLRQIVKDSAANFQQPALMKGLQLTCSVAPGLPELVLGDPVRTRQVLNNLISNGVKFTLAGAVTVTVDRDADLLCFAVADTGIGIAPDRIQEIFEEFSQAESSTSRRFGGAGLGLTISKRLAELMSGSLSAQSAPERGSRFEFRIPLLLPAAVTDPSAERQAVEETATLPSGFRILVVDDNPVNLRICMHFVKRTGASVESAVNGIAAISMHDADPFDLILMDCHMPGLDGWQTTERIRAMHGPASQTPILALTADVFPEVRARCRHSGMNGYLTKPIQVDELHSALRSHALRGAGVENVVG